MQRFDIITEADARVLPRGEPVMLARGGHITPLAADTLKDRRVQVILEGGTSLEDSSLAPRGDIRSIAIASDHTGVALRRTLVRFLRGRGVTVQDLGGEEGVAVDYPDVAAAVAVSVTKGGADAGIVIDGAGIGSAIAANKIAGIRAAMCTNETLARYAREHNGANVLTLGSTLVTAEEAQAIVLTWISTAMKEPRYIRRLAKIRDLERR